MNCILYNSSIRFINLTFINYCFNCNNVYFYNLFASEGSAIRIEGGLNEILINECIFNSCSYNGSPITGGACRGGAIKIYININSNVLLKKSCGFKCFHYGGNFAFLIPGKIEMSTISNCSPDLTPNRHHSLQVIENITNLNSSKNFVSYGRGSCIQGGNSNILNVLFKFCTIIENTGKELIIFRNDHILTISNSNIIKNNYYSEGNPQYTSCNVYIQNCIILQNTDFFYFESSNNLKKFINCYYDNSHGFYIENSIFTNFIKSFNINYLNTYICFGNNILISNKLNTFQLFNTIFILFFVLIDFI